MTQDEVSQLDIGTLHKLASHAVQAAFPLSLTDELMITGVMEGEFRPTISNTHAMMVAAALDMKVCFGDRVVLVSEPAGAQSRSVAYEEKDMFSRLRAMRQAITLLAADYTQYI